MGSFLGDPQTKASDVRLPATVRPAKDSSRLLPKARTGFLLSLILMALSVNFGWAQVTYERLLKAAEEPDNWLTYSGDYAGRRYSALQQVTSKNVQQLAVQWVFQTGSTGQFETTPIALDGILYVTSQDNHAYALDARTGRAIWHYQRRLPDDVRACCGKVNRGFAVLENRLFLATLDAHVVALDAKTANVVWDVEAADYRKGYAFTLAPLLVKDKVIVGASGGEYGIRGFVDAYDAQTGKRAWRFNTTPGPGEPGHETWQGDSWQTGGAPAWLTGTYDPDLNLVYWPTGNPSPDFSGDQRKGDNLYCNSVLALDADTGALKWYFQFTPHDVHDWDATEIPVLVDLEIGGQPRKLLVQANRNGFFYVLDRTNGKFLFARPYVRTTWAKEIGNDGRPVVLAGSDPSPEGTYYCPGMAGGSNWMSPSYSPQTGLLYVAAMEQCDVVSVAPTEYHPGRLYIGSMSPSGTSETGWGAVRALDPRTGKVQWEFKHFSPPWGGVLSTAGGIVFAGDMEGNLIALDARTGKDLWHFQTGAAIYSSAMTYSLGGRQYVIIPSGGALFAFALPEH